MGAGMKSLQVFNTPGEAQEGMEQWKCFRSPLSPPGKVCPALGRCFQVQQHQRQLNPRPLPCSFAPLSLSFHLLTCPQHGAGSGTHRETNWGLFLICLWPLPRASPGEHTHHTHRHPILIYMGHSQEEALNTSFK